MAGDGFRENVFINIHYQLSADFYQYYYFSFIYLFFLCTIFVTSMAIAPVVYTTATLRRNRSSALSCLLTPFPSSPRHRRRVVDFSQSYTPVNTECGLFFFINFFFFVAVFFISFFFPETSIGYIFHRCTFQ